MAVELRCPDCRARLKLKTAPEPGTEVECPECNAVFEAPDDGDAAPARSRRAADDGDDRPRRTGDDDDRPRKKEKKEKPPKAGADPKAPRKRKAKKKETNRTLLTVLIILGVLFLAVVIGMLVWFFTRKPAAYELMNYLPPDCNSVQGANLGHVRKYVEFYKKFESAVNETGFKKAGDAAAKAVGASPDDFIDYMVTGSSPKGESALVIKAKAEFDGSQLSKLPGAKAGTADGRTYYTVDPIPGVFAGRLRVFAPTPRLVVFCPESVPPGTFSKMIAGNAADPDNAVPTRLGALGKQASRGTAWTVILLDTNNRPKAPEKKDAPGGAGEFDGLAATTVQSAKGFALKTSVRSRVVRFEAMVLFNDPEPARNLLLKYRDSALAKSDDASIEPPRFWKDFAQSVVGNKKVGIELFSTLSARTSGDIFIISAESETTTIMDAAGGMVGKMTGTNNSGGGMGGGAQMPPPGGGGGKGPPAAGPGGGAVPPL
ncbi:MAG TPA: hypothetical protein VH092_38025 [Urbifossiella sp.]|nr:hypothetical protein [Urbifossiella sp.]